MTEMDVRGRPANEATRTQEQFRDRPVLAQVEVAADTDTTLYTVPKGRMANVRVYYCENGNATSTIKIWIADDGAANADKQYIVGGPAAGVPILAMEDGSRGPFQLGADDVIKVRASTATVSFTANGFDRPRDTT